MYISKIYIKNFKGYRELHLDLKDGVNILVGQNESRKTTILEAINLVLTGYLNGFYLTKEKISQFIFNSEVVNEYLENIRNGVNIDPPSVRIELFLSDDAPENLMGANNNATSKTSKGYFFQIILKEEYRHIYEELRTSSTSLDSLPLELYDIELFQFSGDAQPRLNLPLKSILIDTSSNTQDTSELMIARKIKSDLDSSDKLLAAQAHRSLKDDFKKHPVHSKLSGCIKDADITVSVDPSAKNSWDTHLSIYFKDIPFSNIGKGRQSIIKTSFALSNQKAQKSNVILVEEPENHLSHSNLNILIRNIQADCAEKQIIITSHSSFVANKLGLDSLVLLDNDKVLNFSELDIDTRSFFQKLPGYDTLRLVLCSKAILVEGDADELVFQRAYADLNEGRLPIQDGIEVISVNNTYKRYIKIAERLNKKVAIAIDVDNKISERTAFKEQLMRSTENINIFFEENDKYEGLLVDHNHNTLEPLLLKYNGLEILNEVFKVNKNNTDELLSYMKSNKTDCALTIFESNKSIGYPKYIIDAIKFIS